jgi:hypothetical protein
LRALILASLLVPAVAGANGRAAAVMSITHRAGSTQDILLGTTFGTLISRDGGATFHWYCERIAGYLSGDPVWRWLADGTIVATVPRGSPSRATSAAASPAPAAPRASAPPT